MANYWAIAIGINQYQRFQPLHYAQRDAQRFREFLIQEAGFAPNRCYLLTEQMGAAPIHDNIEACITQVCQRHLQPDDVLWCFFSGHGVQLEGTDYLVPLDADPERLAQTAIPVDRLFSLFETAPTRNIILVLDVNRSQSVLPTEGMGQHTTLLAKEHGIATLLSCAPDQISHETLALRQGLFTAALLDGLHHHACVTLSHLAEFLTQRLPDLSEQHWRPRQDLFAEIPADRKHLLIVPEAAAIALGGSAEPAFMGQLSGTAMLEGESAIDFGDMDWGTGQTWTLPYLGNAATATPFPNPASSTGTAGSAALRPDLIDLSAALPLDGGDNSEATVDPDSLFWRRLLIWSSVVAVALLTGVVLRTISSFGDRPQLLDDASPLSTDPETSPSIPPLVETSPADSAPSSVPSSDPAEVTSPPASTASPILDIAPGSVLESADLAIRARDFVGARQQLDLVSADQQTSAYRQLLEQANKGLLTQAKVMLTRTRELSTENQAADFAESIELLQQIRPGEPRYDEAQHYIDRWSQVILDMAQGRAERRNDRSTSIAAENYKSAIATARLVPRDRTNLRRQAEQAMNYWSEKILELAVGRAREGLYDVAIQTADLVPPDSSSYAAAQQAMAEWRTKPSVLADENEPGSF